MNTRDMNVEDFAQEEDDQMSRLCMPDEHEMIDLGDDDNQYFMCTKCGYSATGYIYQNFMSEPF